MKAQSFILSNLNCPNCAAKLERAVRALPGVKEARVSFGSGILTVEYDETALSDRKVREVIRQFNLDITTVMPARGK